MKRKIGRVTFAFAIVLILMLISPMFTSVVYAKDLDKIHTYRITADVQSDGKVKMTYHIDWEVLDSTSEGPLTWVKIGIANKHVEKITGKSKNIKSIKYYNDGGSFIRIDFNKYYYVGDLVSFEFEIVQDYIYQMNALKEGETVYTFIPGWFDDINVEKMIMKWGNDKVESFTPAGIVENGYITWENKMPKGKKLEFNITYLNSAFDFDVSKSVEAPEKDYGAIAVGISYVLIIILTLTFSIVSAIRSHYTQSANMSGTTKRKVKRTKVTYYAQCPSCSAPREEGRDNCTYCGRSMIQSEEILEEKEIKELDPELKRNKNNDGLYRFTSSPNVYMRVHTTRVYVPTPVNTGHHGHSVGHGCACACACACAGGGRAGCSTKDFYNTGLKLRQLQLRKKAK